ncbi:MAG: MBL fold metallo-hydrolase [Promethearchaeota archaeon]
MYKTEVILMTNNHVSPFQEIKDDDALEFVEINRSFITRSLGEHGLGFLVNIYKIEKNNKPMEEKPIFTFAFDVGSFNQTFLNNAKVQGIRLDDIECVALSHWHFDHSGALYPLLKQIKNEVPVLCHRNANKERFFKRSFEINLQDYDNKKRDVIEPLISSQKVVNQEPVDLQKMKQLGGKIVFTNECYEIFSQNNYKIILSGEIPRNHDLEISKDFLINQDGILRTDSISDDMCVIIEKEDSVSVLLGCCHSGIMNTLDHVKRLTDKPINYVIGGFHMASANEQRLEKTIEYLLNFQSENKPLYLFPIHCTGDRFLFEMKKKSTPLVKAYNASVGTIFNL